jgi:hypothetical protein
MHAFGLGYFQQQYAGAGGQDPRSPHVTQSHAARGGPTQPAQRFWRAPRITSGRQSTILMLHKLSKNGCPLEWWERPASTSQLGSPGLLPGLRGPSPMMMELHWEFLMHIQSIFTMEVSNYYQEILGKGTTSHPRGQSQVLGTGHQAPLGYVSRYPQGLHAWGRAWQHQE